MDEIVKLSLKIIELLKYIKKLPRKPTIINRKNYPIDTRLAKLIIASYFPIVILLLLKVRVL